MARRSKKKDPVNSPDPYKVAERSSQDDYSVKGFEELIAKVSCTGPLARPRKKVVSPYFQIPPTPPKSILSPCSQIAAERAALNDRLLPEDTLTRCPAPKLSSRQDSMGKKKIRLSPSDPPARPRKKVVSPYFQKGNIRNDQIPLTPPKSILSPCSKKTIKGAVLHDPLLPEDTLARCPMPKPPPRRDSKGKKKIKLSPYFVNNNASKEKADKAKKLREEKRKLRELFPWKRTTLRAAKKKSEAYRRKSADNKWVPPRSRHHLMQEDHFHDPWRVLVICMLLNVTTGRQTRQILDEFFERYPDAETAAEACESEMEGLIRGMGLQRKRTQMIKRLSVEYLDENWTYVTELHGVGKYAADAYATFCNGKWEGLEPGDHKLRDYWMDSFIRVNESCAKEL